jgi:hypothetical protein
MCGRYGRRGDKQRIAEWIQTHTLVSSMTLMKRTLLLHSMSRLRASNQ